MLSHSFYGGNSNIYLGYETLSLIIKCNNWKSKSLMSGHFGNVFREEIGAERKAQSATKGQVGQGQLVPPTILSKLSLNFSAQDGVFKHQVELAGDQIMNALDEEQRTNARISTTYVTQTIHPFYHWPLDDKIIYCYRQSLGKWHSCGRSIMCLLDKNDVFVKNHVILQHVLFSNMLFKYQTMNGLFPHIL